MEFKDIQVVWDQQEEQPQFVVDADALYGRLERNDIKTRRLQAFEEWMFSLMAAVVGVLTISEPILEHKEYHQLPIGAIFLGLSLFFLLKKIQRRREEPVFDQSFIGIIDGSIDRIEAYSRWVKRANILFWLCTSATVLISLVLYYDSKPIWLWFALVVMLFASYIGVRKQLRNKAASIENLKSLREQFDS